MNIGEGRARSTESRFGCPSSTTATSTTSPRSMEPSICALDGIREKAPLVWNQFATGYWVATGYDLVRDIFHDTGTFSSSSIDPLNPDPKVRSIPTKLGR